MWNWIEENFGITSEILFPLGICTLIVGVVVLAIWTAKSDSDACAAHGGHIISKTSPAYGYANGGIVTTFNTVSFCISQDGRILY